MISNGEGWHYFAVKKLFALLKGTKSNYVGGFYSVNCLNSFTTKNELELYKKICENKGFCNILMPSENTNVLKY